MGLKFTHFTYYTSLLLLAVVVRASILADTLIYFPIAIAIHEVTLFLMMRYLSYHNPELFLSYSFRKWLPSRNLGSVEKKAFVILAAPIAGIALGQVLAVYAAEIENESLWFLSQVFLMYNLFQLLPISPLKGGALLTLLLNKKSTPKTRLQIGAAYLIFFYVAAFSLPLRSFFIIQKNTLMHVIGCT